MVKNKLNEIGPLYMFTDFSAFKRETVTMTFWNIFVGLADSWG